MFDYQGQLIYSLGCETYWAYGSLLLIFTLMEPKRKVDVTMTLQLAFLEKWRTDMGLLPVPLYGDPDESRFIMLDGRSGSFCLDLSGDASDRDGRSVAWSVNVGHYVSVKKKEVEVQRWDMSPSTYDKYSLASVLRDMEGFHYYLARSHPERELSIVKHAMRVFRKLRTVMGGNADGHDALRVFLLLLACAHDGQSREELDTPKWELTEQTVAMAEAVRPGDWVALIDEFRSGRQLEKLEAYTDLVLRHASGEIFQEAHFEVTNYSQNQMRMDGFLPTGLVGEKPPSIKGVHFTPPSLARAVVEESIHHLDLSSRKVIHIFDPSCGSGEFLREALRLLRLKGYAGKVELTGWDISGSACDLARFTLANERDSIQKDETDIVQKDSLEGTSSWDIKPDLILMNPPFVSWKDMSPAEREKVTEIVPGSSARRGDMAFAFIWKAATTLIPEGIMGTILPASTFGSYSARNLRKHIIDKITPLLIARLGSHQLFAKSLVDTGLLIAAGRYKDWDEALALWSDHRSRSTSAALRSLRRIRQMESGMVLPALGDGYSIYSLPQAEIEKGASWAPREYSSWILNKKLSGFTRVQDLFTVRQGTRTGNNQVFMLDASEYEDLPNEERQYFRLAIVNKTIVSGQLKKVAYVFYPHGNKEISDDEELMQVVPTYFKEKLRPAKKLLMNRAGIDENRWWELTWHRSWQEKQFPKLVSTYYGASGSFGWDHGGEFVVVQGWAWLPVGDDLTLDERLGHAYLTILNSTLFSKLIAAHSNHVSGGQWTLSKQFMRDIPLPDLASETIDPNLIKNLWNIGERIRKGDGFDTQVAEELVRVVYGLDEV